MPPRLNKPIYVTIDTVGTIPGVGIEGPIQKPTRVGSITIRKLVMSGHKVYKEYLNGKKRVLFTTGNIADLINEPVEVLKETTNIGKVPRYTSESVDPRLYAMELENRKKRKAYRLAALTKIFSVNYANLFPETLDEQYTKEVRSKLDKLINPEVPKDFYINENTLPKDENGFVKVDEIDMSFMSIDEKRYLMRQIKKINENHKRALEDDTYIVLE